MCVLQYLFIIITASIKWFKIFVLISCRTFYLKILKMCEKTEVLSGESIKISYFIKNIGYNNTQTRNTSWQGMDLEVTC